MSESNQGNGPVALVTGGSRGIGRAISVELARRGWIVAINFRSGQAQAEATLAEIKSRNGHGFLLPGDISKEADVQNMYDVLNERCGRLDILVNNAGILRDNFAVMMTNEEWDSVIDVNLRGAFLMLRPALKWMSRKKRGRIINMVSISGLIGTPGQINYAASKGAIISMTRTLAREYGKYGILVNAIAPGFVKTEMIEGISERRVEESKKMIPLGRFGMPEEIAKLTGFLASEENTYITGQTLVIDGGLSV